MEGRGGGIGGRVRSEPEGRAETDSGRRAVVEMQRAVERHVTYRLMGREGR